MIFMTMSEDEGANALPVFDQIGNIRHDDVHAQQFGLGEHQTGVNDDDVIAPTHSHAIHSKLAQTAEGHNLQFSSWHFRCPLIVARRMGKSRNSGYIQRRMHKTGTGFSRRLDLWSTRWLNNCENHG